MENAVNETSKEMSRKQAHSSNRFGNWKFVTSIIAIVLILALAVFYYYQSTRFNANITINGTKVGGLTADKTLEKLKSTVLKNEVYIGKDLIIDEKDTKAGFSEKDLPNVKKLLDKQRTFFPSSKAVHFSLVPTQDDQNQGQTMKKLLEDKLTTMNQSLTAPHDAQVQLVQGNITVSKSVDGKQYDTASLLKGYEKQEFKSQIHLNAAYIQPVKEDSPIIDKEKKALQDLLQRSIDYKVQDKVYSLKASDLIKTATVSKDLQVTFDTGDIKNKINEINNTQATLNKDIPFKTHSGAVISVRAQGYGWAINADKEAARLQEAFAKGEKSLPASNIYGNGWSKEGIGYENITNNGIGDTYAEVSIAEQREWFYKNGQLVFTSNVVTGRHNTHEDTHPGIWYILFKKSPSILRGTSVGHGGSYAVKVNYWAPFTNDGQGFHDASWRTNWASNAYIGNGSGGCVNNPPNVMKTVYDSLSTKEPVVIY